MYLVLCERMLLFNLSLRYLLQTLQKVFRILLSKKVQLWRLVHIMGVSNCYLSDFDASYHSVKPKPVLTRIQRWPSCSERNVQLCGWLQISGDFEMLCLILCETYWCSKTRLLMSHRFCKSVSNHHQRKFQLCEAGICFWNASSQFVRDIRFQRILQLPNPPWFSRRINRLRIRRLLCGLIAPSDGWGMLLLLLFFVLGSCAHCAGYYMCLRCAGWLPANSSSSGGYIPAASPHGIPRQCSTPPCPCDLLLDTYGE